MTCFKVQPHNICHTYMGQSEKCVAELFREAKRCAPSLIVFEEMDSLFGSRDSHHDGAMKKIKSELLNFINVKFCGIMIIGTTNYPNVIDKAFARRFEAKYFIRLPNKSELYRMLTYILTGNCSFLIVVCRMLSKMHCNIAQPGATMLSNEQHCKSPNIT